MELANRAYAAFEVKALNAEKRTFSGWATTPSTDRVGDVVNPLGVRFKNPLVLLHGHRHDLPIGNAYFDTPTKKGVKFEAEIPVVEDGYGDLKRRVDTAWGELKYGIVRFVSIGFRALKYSFRDDGVDYEETEVFELSIVPVPALEDAAITAVKSMQQLTPDIVKALRHAESIERRAIPLIKSREASLARGAVEIICR
jgi:HK97 family phage prohead protease